MSLTVLAAAMLAVVCASMPPWYKVQADDPDRDNEFVDAVLSEIKLIDSGGKPAGPFKISASAATVWCTDRQLCKYGYFVSWDESGFQVRKYRMDLDALQAECAKKQEQFDKLNLKIQCEE